MPFRESPQPGFEGPPKKRGEELSPSEQLDRLRGDKHALEAWMRQPDANVRLDQIRLEQINTQIVALEEKLGIKVSGGEGAKEGKSPSSASETMAPAEKPKG